MSTGNWDQLVQTQLLQAQALEGLAQAFNSTVTFPAVVNIGTLNATTVNATTVNATTVNATQVNATTVNISDYFYIKRTTVTAADGTNNNLQVDSSYGIIIGPTVDYTVTGFVPATTTIDNQFLYVYSPSVGGSGLLQINSLDPSSDPGNQILTQTGTTRFFATPCLTFYTYFGGGPFWLLLS